jgi:hypothetical protein
MTSGTSPHAGSAGHALSWVVWIATAAILWIVASSLVDRLLYLSVVRVAHPVLRWAVIAVAMFALGYLIVRLLVTRADAPRGVWIGVAAAAAGYLALSVWPVFMFGTPSSWSPLNWTEMLATYLLPALAAVAGSWLAARRLPT